MHKNKKRGICNRMRKRILIVLAVITAIVFTSTFASAQTKTVSRYNGSTYTHADKYDDCIVVNGVDVSVYQKTTDWKKAKADGIDFAIIRVGGRGYGAAGNMYADDYFKKNIEGAKAAGLMVGIYFFSQAINELEAVAEANYALELLGDYDLDLPVFMDYEFSGGSAGRLTKAKLSKTKATNIARTFCETIENNSDHKAGIYANRTFLLNTIDGKQLAQSYMIWLAQYYTVATYYNDYQIWQYASNGKVDGNSARNDMNFMYLQKNPSATGFYSIANANAVLAGDDTFTYDGTTAFQPDVYVTYNGSALNEGTDYTVKYVNNVESGTGYAVVMGKGMYSDYTTIPFTISNTSSLSGIKVSTIKDQNYTGQAIKPTVTVTDPEGRTMTEGLDYTVSYSNNTNVGTATAKITFRDNYTGSKTVKFSIVKADQVITVADDRTSASVDDGSYNLGATLKFSGASLTYASDNKDVATVSSAGKVTIKGAGTAKLTIKAASTSNTNSATKTITLAVVGKKQTVTTAYTRYTRNEGAASFNLKAATDGDGMLIYASDNASVATVDRDGTVTVKGAGTAHITVTAMATSKYSEGSKEVTLTVNALSDDEKNDKTQRIIAGVKNTKVVSLKAEALGAKKVKLTWKKSNSGYAVDYFQIWRSQKKSSGYQKMFNGSSGTARYYINTKQLQPNTTYWYKVRGVRKVDGKLVYTDFTKVQVKTLK